MADTITIHVCDQVEEKVNKMQRQYLLQEQLKIIKRELGLQVTGSVNLPPLGHLSNTDTFLSARTVLEGNVAVYTCPRAKFTTKQLFRWCPD